MSWSGFHRCYGQQRSVCSITLLQVFRLTNFAWVIQRRLGHPFCDDGPIDFHILAICQFWHVTAALEMTREPFAISALCSFYLSGLVS